MSNETLWQKVELSFQYPVHFTSGVFDSKNPCFLETISYQEPQRCHKFIVIIDDAVVKHHPQLIAQLHEYTRTYSASLSCEASPLVVQGGELIKNDLDAVYQIQEQIHRLALCRQSYVVAIGGGAVLDMVGFAASTPHRGLRLVRIPTTVLSQNDSGIGVKNAINRFGKKNFLGTFVAPFAVINDAYFLETLHDRDWISGVAEALKVALIRDPEFFETIESQVSLLVKRDLTAMQQVIQHCAQLHLDHIRYSGDPFEFGSARPLDFGHWAAHKLEALSGYELRHGEAVAYGIALDSYYSYLAGLLSHHDCMRVIRVIQSLGFELRFPEITPEALLEGLSEFQEHLGGQLHITLLQGIGQGIEVNEMQPEYIVQAMEYLQVLETLPA